VFVALVIQEAKRVRRIILSSATYLAVPYISKILEKKSIEHKCAF